jgi:hypothetical protein
LPASRRGQRHRRHASHVMPSGMLDSIGTTDWCWSELRQAKVRPEDRFGTR